VKYRVQVLDRILVLLETLADAEDDIGPTELAARLHLHKSTIHRLLMVLEQQRFIRKDSRGKYGLGMKLFELGNRAIARVNLPERAQPMLRALVNQTGETAHISMLSGSEMLSITNVQGRWTLRTPATVGRRAPVHCTAVGKAFIAFLPKRMLDDVIAVLEFTRFTVHTIATPVALRLELAKVRDRGFAVDDEEFEEGLRCVAAPIFNHTGLVIASVSVAGPVFRITKKRLPELARVMVTTAQALSADLGYQSAPSRKVSGS
jgi:DNA-binding IclR family transcriptional regulator